MRVEQRIGRIDRVGQKSSFVSVINFMHHNTIDEDVWVRLYERLGLCESTLGGLEDIISFELRDIEKSLTASLSMKEKREMLDQKAQAIANKKK